MIYPVLNEAKALLSSIDDVQSLRIGLERGIGAKDCPFLRIVPSKLSGEGQYATLVFQVIFGFDLKNRKMEEVYQSYFDMEERIRAALEGKMDAGNCYWIETVTDEDEVPNLKTGVAIFAVSNIPLRTRAW